MADWGLKIGIDGEADFRQAVADINSNIRLLNSELKLSETAFNNGEKNLTEMTFEMARSSVNAEKLTESIRATREALLDSNNSIDASERQIQNWVTQLNNAEVRVSGLEHDIDDLGTELGQLEDESTLAAYATDKTTGSIGDLSTQIKANLSQNLSNAREKMGELGEKFKGVGDVVRHPISSFKTFWGEVKSGELSLGKLGETLSNKLTRSLKDASEESEETSDDIEDVGESAEDSGKKSSTFGDMLKANILSDIIMSGLREMAELAKAVGKAFVDGAKFVVDAGMEYESAFAGVKKTMEGTPEELQAVSDGLRAMSTEIPVSSSELAGLAAHAAQLGIENDSILGFTKTIAGLGEATNLAGTEGAEMMARFTNITGMEQSNENFSRLGSTIVALGNNFATTEADIMTMATRLSAAGTQVGMSESDILGLATALSSVGVEAEAGGTAMSKALIKMSAASSNYDELNAIMAQTGTSLRDLQMLQSHDAKGWGEMADSLGMTKKELNNPLKSGVEMQGFADISGMTAAQFKQAFETDATGALQAFIQGLDNAEEKGETAISLLTEMGISEVRLRDSLLRAANASTVFADAQDIATQAWSDNNALTKEVENRYSTLESKVGMLKNSVSNFGIALYQSNNEALGSIVDAAKGYMTSLTSAFESGGMDALLEQVGFILQDVLAKILAELPKIIPLIMDVLLKISDTIIANLPLIIEAAMQILDAIITGLSGNLEPLLMAAFTLLTSVTDLILANLPMIIGLAFELLIALATGIIQYIPELIPAILETINGIVQMIMDNLQMILEVALQLILALVEGITAALPELIPVIIDLLLFFVGFIVDNIGLIIDVAIKIMLALINGILQSIPELVAAIPRIISAIVTTIIGLIPQILQVGISLIKGLISGIISMLGAVIESVISIGQGIVQGAKDFVDRMKSIGKELITGLWQGIQDMKDYIFNKISDFCGGIVDKFKSIFKIFSPSRLMRDDIGVMLVQGVGEGIEDEAPKLEKQIENAIPTEFDVEPDVTVPNFFDMISDIEKDAKPLKLVVIPNADEMRKFDRSLEITIFPNIENVQARFIKIDILPNIEKFKEALIPLNIDVVPSVSDVKIKPVEADILPKISGLKNSLKPLEIDVFPNMDGMKNAVMPLDMSLNNSLNSAFGKPMESILIRLDAMSTILSGILGLSAKQIVLDNGVLVGELAPEMEVALSNLARMQGR